MPDPNLTIADAAISEEREDSRIVSGAEIRESGEEPAKWIPIREAASVLGVSVRAVQLQAKNGRIASRKQSNRVFVCLGSPGERHSPANETRSEGEANHEVRESSQMVEQLRSEVDYLRAELTIALAARNQSDSEWRILMAGKERTEQDLRQRLAAYEQQLAIQEAPMAAPTVEHTPENADQSAQSPPSEDLASNVDNPPRRSWWARLFGWKE